MSFRQTQQHPRGHDRLASNPDFLYSIFQRVDKDRSGKIDERELQQSLSNGTWKPFNIETVRLMISMFDVTRKGTIDFQGFQSLWKFVTEWQRIFQTYDRDNSGSINRNEMMTALSSFGYRLSESFYSILIGRFDRHKQGAIYFDDFIQACITLHIVTNYFKELDVNKTGSATLTYEQFLTAVFSIQI